MYFCDVFYDITLRISCTNVCNLICPIKVPTRRHLPLSETVLYYIFVRWQTRMRASFRELNRLRWLKRSVSNFQTTIDAVNRPGNEVDVIEPSGTEDDHAENTDEIHEVYIMNPKHEDRASSFFAQPGVLAGKWQFFLIFLHKNFATSSGYQREG